MGLFKKNQNQDVELYAPIHGELLSLEQVPDPVFAQKMMGEGIAILAKGDTVYAPANGTVLMIAESKHAFGMKLENGTEIMIHVGLETVNLKGEGFHTLVDVNEKVTRGTPILKIDMPLLKGKGLNLCTPIIIINHQQHPFSVSNVQGNAVANETLLFKIQ